MNGASGFREALLHVPARERDAWVDRLFGLPEIPEDGPDLPPGCVPYLPAPVDAVLRAVDGAAVRATDVLVDVGSGLGRTAALVHLLTGARVVGIEVQAQLVRGAQALVARLGIERVRFLHGDAVQRLGDVPDGSVFFLYAPFSGARLEAFVDGLEVTARERELRICSLDLPLPERAWLEEQEVVPPGDLTLFRTRPSSGVR